MTFEDACCQGVSKQVSDFIGRTFDLVARRQTDGGVLLHGALAEKEGAGVLLLGPSGRGKTTASRRLPRPWKSLSDDMALAMPGGTGAWSWRAHPWPSLTRCLNGEDGGSRELQRSVALHGLFFLLRAPGDRVERIGSGRAACLLVESFEQAWLAGSALVADDVMKEIRGQAFLNIATLVSEVPAFLLHISPAGPFWTDIEAALDGD